MNLRLNPGLADEVFDQGAVVDGLGAEDAGARVVAQLRQGGEALRLGPGDDDGAAVEGELERCLVHALIVPLPPKCSKTPSLRLPCAPGHPQCQPPKFVFGLVVHTSGETTGRKNLDGVAGK